MFPNGFRAALAARQEEIDSLVCVGLDPLVEKIPSGLNIDLSNPGLLAEGIYDWMRSVVDATVKHASMFKPQIAHWESFLYGTDALRELILYIHQKYPEVPVFLDAKRGDIGRTQQRYQEAVFKLLGADGVNFSPYMGCDCMKGLVSPQYSGKALVGLCYTSNPASRQVQDVMLRNGSLYWEFIAQATLDWARGLKVVKDAGLVMAAAYEFPENSGQAYSRHLSRGREIVGDQLWFLVPGIGTQGGFVEATVKAAYCGWGSIALNSSSGIIFASEGTDFARAAAAEARNLKDQIREAMPA